jgi:hypothetical protein
MTAESAISPAVLAYRPPHPPHKEFTPPRDRALFADSTKKSLLAQASAADEINPNIGTELKGVQLSKLTAKQKDELALLVAEVCCTAPTHLTQRWGSLTDRTREAWSSSETRTLRLNNSTNLRRTRHRE